jgi:hypothetical protein
LGVGVCILISLKFLQYSESLNNKIIGIDIKRSKMAQPLIVPKEKDELGENVQKTFFNFLNK